MTVNKHVKLVESENDDMTSLPLNEDGRSGRRLCVLNNQLYTSQAIRRQLNSCEANAFDERDCGW